ncbi:MAG: hypothetical protein M3033_11660 [Acidobacteriota bacterium]|nr:hypothetical protein [Acidobacteriota bacterium]
MITAEQASEILKQYKKHGWTLRRVLLSAATNEVFSGALESLFGDAPVESSDIDAAWFSRPSAGGNEAWELRRLSAAPFALVEIFDDDDEEDVREEVRREMEKQMESGKRKMEDEE